MNKVERMQDVKDTLLCARIIELNFDPGILKPLSCE